jgi:uncharacterized protein YndB with AHSA1/START domain
MTQPTGDTLTMTLPSDVEIVMTRAFNAPRSLVFEAWTKTEHLKNWFGPRGFTLPVCEIDLRPGGAYRFVMRGPDGTDYASKGEYRVIAPPERLVYTDVFDHPGVSIREALVTVTFEEIEGRTMLTSTSVYQSVEDRDAVLEMGVEQGWAETLDRLAEFLGTKG